METLGWKLPLLLGFLGGLAAFLLGIVAAWRATRHARARARRTLSEAVREAESKAAEIVVVAQEKALSVEEELDRREGEIEARESTLENRAQSLDRETSSLSRQRRDLDRHAREQSREEARLARERDAVQAAREEARAGLERIAGLSAQQARQELVASIEKDARREARRLARKIQDEALDSAEREALNLLIQATQRINIKKSVETTVSFIELPSDEMKGRIIGREGRNIRALETATGIDLIVDDTPRSILISCFDPVRREIARVAIERLIEDGRIHPARIEDVVEKVRSEIETLIDEEGTQAAFELGISDLHPRLLRLVGRLKFRTHHGQNLLRHSMEVALVAGHMADEVSGRVEVARRAGLLHEIGRVQDDATGHSTLVSADLAAKYGESEAVVHAIQSLHPEINADSLEATLLQAANRISNNRPGARKDNLQVFIERLKRIEEIARGFAGVQHAYAVKAGRELRVMVDASGVKDEQAQTLSKKIARAVEKDISFPGKIRVSVVRETRAIHYAL